MLTEQELLKLGIKPEKKDPPYGLILALFILYTLGLVLFII